MFYVLFFAAAFLFMIADRKIRTSSVAASCVSLIPCIIFARRILVGTKANITGYRGTFYTGFFLTATLSLLLAAVVILILYILGSLLGKAVMPVSKEDSSNRIVASIFYISGMCLTLICALILIVMGLMLSMSGSRLALNPTWRNAVLRFRNYIRVFMITVSGLRFFLFLFGVILLFILSFCIVRIAVRKGLFRDLKTYVKPDKKDLKRSKALLIGEILSGIGVLGTIVIAIVCLLTPKGKGRIYFFDGYDYTKAFSALAFVLMLAGTVLLIIGLINLLVKKQAKLQKLNIYIASVLIMLSCSSSFVLIFNAMRFVFRIR